MSQGEAVRLATQAGLVPEAKIDAQHSFSAIAAKERQYSSPKKRSAPSQEFQEFIAHLRRRYPVIFICSSSRRPVLNVIVCLFAEYPDSKGVSRRLSRVWETFRYFKLTVT
jgi:hypothetical protein